MALDDTIRLYRAASRRKSNLSRAGGDALVKSQNDRCDQVIAQLRRLLSTRAPLPFSTPRLFALGNRQYNAPMTLEELEKSVSDLPADQLARFRQWFLAFDAENWDRQFEADVVAGRLDRLADEAAREHRSGGSSRL